MTVAAATAPLVSVLMFVRNGGAPALRAARTVLNQSWTNLELVVQDGASTDGTAEALAALDPRVKVVSEADGGPADGFWRALHRCEGDFVGSCLADEAMEPGAIQAAVAHFQAHPHAGALIGDALACDLDHTPIRPIPGQPFDLIEFMAGRYMPYFNASFFRMAALRNVGLGEGGPGSAPWNRECLEFEIWLRLATEWGIDLLPRTVARYAWHDQQLSNRPTHVLRHALARLELLERAVSAEGFFGDNPTFRDFCLLGQCEVFRDHLLSKGHKDAATAIEHRMQQIRKRAGGDPMLQRSADDRMSRRWTRLAYATPGWLRDAVGPAAKAIARRALFAMGHAIQKAQTAIRPAEAVSSARDPLAAFNREAGQLFENRGQMDQALECYRRAFAKGDDDSGSLACQIVLKLPGATEADQMAIQTEWAARMTVSEPADAPRRPIRRDGRIAVGYVGSVWLSPYMRYQVANFMTRHDRSRFRVVVYTGLRDTFPGAEKLDTVRWVGNLDDEAFAAQVRADGIDILVELNGFSPGHRFGALAARAAPVQVSYVNHDATCGTPNVDWLLADEVAAPAGIDGDYSEGLWRLPGCFVCFDYRGTSAPEPAPPPCLQNGYVTFGCFGSPSKLNPDQAALWARLLHHVPGARLLLRNGGLTAPANRAYVTRLFARHGIEADRLCLLPGADRDTVLADHAKVDISLDTWPYCGGNTIAESLWQGVPVVTLKGRRFAAAYGASLLTASGCADLVAETPDQFVAIAAALAANTARLSHYRSNLRAMVVEHGLSNSESFVRRIETAYAQMIDLKGS